MKNTKQGSLIREEREKEDSKFTLSIDQHRDQVRGETTDFVNHVSPQRVVRSIDQLYGSPQYQSSQYSY